jgi:FMN phosphatase YigB (HAD superfamily)
VLGAEEVPQVNLVSFVARQLGISPAAFAKYSQRDQTRREQLAELMEWLHYRTFDRASFRHYLAWLTPIAQNVRKPDRLVEMLLEELRGRRILIPTAHESNKRRLKRLLRQLFRSELSAHLKATITRDKKNRHTEGSSNSRA